MSGNISGYVVPIKSDGTEAVGAGRGLFTLTAGATYYLPLGGADASIISAHLAWTGSALVITSATVEDCNMPHGDVLDYTDEVGEWIDENPTTAFVGVDGTGVSQTNGVVAATGDAGGGGCLFHVTSGARRTRIKVVVGATGGTIRCGVHGKA